MYIISMTSNERPQDEPILIEFTRGGGLQPVGKLDFNVLKEKSAQAIDHAMMTINKMGERITTTVNHMTEQPNSVEVEFGLKFDVEAGVIIAKAGAEAGVTVKLVWNKN
jgi:hypothetical protein